MTKVFFRFARGLACLALVVTLAACGGSSSSDPSSYIVSVTVTSTVANGESFVFGLGTQSTTVSAQNVAVRFSQALASGSGYSVTQLSGPRPCTLTNASGTLSANVSVGADCSGPSPVVTALGSVISSVSPSTQSIGPAGGTVSSSDGRLTLSVPANALSAATTLSIQSISNTAPGGRGNGYRLQPDGLTFAQPVTLTMSYTDSDIAGGSAQALGIATQAADGTWSRATPTVDTVNKTVSVTSSHFSDWSLVEGLSLRPPTATVRVGNTQTLDVVTCFAPRPGSSNVALGYDCANENYPLYLKVDNCSVNGVAGGNSALGQVSYDNAGTATYTAPAAVPSPATVTVSCDAAYFNAPTKYTLISNITVVGPTYSGTFSADVNLTLLHSSVATATLSGFVLDTANSVAGDVAKYINGVGTAQVTVTLPLLSCTPVVQDVTFSATLWVWAPKSPSAGGAFASRYALMVDQASIPISAADCGGVSVPTGATAIALAMDCANSWPTTMGITVGSTQPYSDPSKLSGSVALTCTVSAGGGISTDFTENFQWNLQAQ